MTKVQKQIRQNSKYFWFLVAKWYRKGLEKILFSSWTSGNVECSFDNCARSFRQIPEIWRSKSETGIWNNSFPHWPEGIEGSKINSVFLNTSSRNCWKVLLQVCLKIELEGGPTKPKNKKICTFEKKRITFCWDQLEKSPLHQKNLTSKILTGKKLLLPWEKYYPLRKKELKVTKKRFFGYGILTTCRKSLSPAMTIENKYNTVINARNRPINWE